MCGRITLKTPGSDVAKRFLVELSRELRDGVVPRYNIAPGGGVLTVWDDRDAGRRKADFFHWGLVPRWADDVNIGYKMINARSETAMTKPAFKDSMRYRRCLIPADGFYEWKREGKQKTPYYFQVDEGALFGMAGLWAHWQSPDGSEIYSCSILTTDGNAVMAPIHHRMPVIIDPADFDRWLDPSVYDAERVAGLLRPFPADRMGRYQVSMAVNSARNEGPELIEPGGADSPPGQALDFFDQLFPNEGGPNSV